MLSQMLASKNDREQLQGDFYDPFLESIKSNNCKSIKMLIKTGLADVNKIYQGYGADGRTPLHFAAELGSKDVVLLLLSNGANPKALTNSGFSALHLAAQYGHVDIFEPLVQAGIDINLQSEVRTTALHEAARNGHQTSVSKLLALKATSTTKTLCDTDKSSNESIEDVKEMLKSLTLSTSYKKDFIKTIQILLRVLSDALLVADEKSTFQFIMDLRLAIEGVTSADYVYNVTREFLRSEEFKKHIDLLKPLKVEVIKLMKEYNENQVRAITSRAVTTTDNVSNNEIKKTRPTK